MAEIVTTPESTNNLPRLKARDKNSHKYDYGNVIIIAGSLGMSGAAVLAAKAALRAGAGLVTVFVPGSIYLPVASGIPEVMVKPVGENSKYFIAENAKTIRTVLSKLKSKKCSVILGPGLGFNKPTIKFIQKIAIELELPLVLDADGLNAFASSAENLAARAQPTVLTPHVGEAKRLIGNFDGNDENARVDGAKKLAKSTRSIVALKGHRTVLTDSDTHLFNPTGNAGMATAGAGDVLAGIVGAFLAQGLMPFDATQLAVYLHGRAGDLAAEKTGEVSLIASDIIAELPRAILECSS